MVTTALKVGSLSSLTNQMYLANAVQTYKPSKVIYEGLLNHVNAGSAQKVSGANVWLVSGSVTYYILLLSNGQDYMGIRTLTR